MNVNCEKILRRTIQEPIGAPLHMIRVWIREFSPKEFMAAGELYGRQEKNNSVCNNAGIGDERLAQVLELFVKVGFAGLVLP
jgi:hypothetical protein